MMKKLLASLLAAMMLCAGLSQLAFADDNTPDDLPIQPPIEDGEGDDDGDDPSQPPKGDDGLPVIMPMDYIGDPAEDGN